MMRDKKAVLQNKPTSLKQRCVFGVTEAHYTRGFQEGGEVI